MSVVRNSLNRNKEAKTYFIKIDETMFPDSTYKDFPYACSFNSVFAGCDQIFFENLFLKHDPECKNLPSGVRSRALSYLWKIIEKEKNNIKQFLKITGLPKNVTIKCYFQLILLKND